MNDLEPLEAADVVKVNESYCHQSGENHALLDPTGLEAAVARPWNGFGEIDAFPTVYLKAAALLHGLASRQLFENGNKRTAWTCAVAFLDVNGVDIGQVETVQADMFVRAVALDHSLEMTAIAEWFEVAHQDATLGDD